MFCVVLNTLQEFGSFFYTLELLFTQTILHYRKNYNVSKKEDAKVPQCPPEKEAAIMDALQHFQMV